MWQPVPTLACPAHPDDVILAPIAHGGCPRSWPATSNQGTVSGRVALWADFMPAAGPLRPRGNRQATTPPDYIPAAPFTRIPGASPTSISPAAEPTVTDELRHLVHDWDALAQPTLTRFTCTFEQTAAPVAPLWVSRHRARASWRRCFRAGLAWRAMELRSCFAGLASGLQTDLVEGSESRWLFDYHRDRLEKLFASQPDLPLHQDTVAGFVHGFMVTGAYFVADDSIEQESMRPVLGGALLLGQDLPIDDDPADVTAGLGFFERAAGLLGSPDETGVSRDLVSGAFTTAPDVPMTCASLGGFCLGVLFTIPYLTTESDAGPVALLTAACELARDLTP